MDEADVVLAWMLAKCKSPDELERRVKAHATIVQHLVCCLARQVDQSDAGIRALYSAWADMAVEEFRDPRAVTRWRPH